MILLFVFLSLCFACTKVGDSTDCSGNGICIMDQRNNSTRCACDAGFLGATCADLCSMVGFANECSQHGICAFDQRANGTRCLCDMGFYGRYCNSNVTFSPTPAPTVAPSPAPTGAPSPPLTVAPSPQTALTTASTVQTIAPTTAVQTDVTTIPTVAPVTTVQPLTMGSTSAFSNCVDYTNYLKGGVEACSGHGTCELYPPGFPNTGYHCKCEDRYFGTYCQNEYKSKLTAFLLEFFVGWTGAESFYIGDTTAGVFKLLLGLFGCCGIICAAAIFMGSEGEKGGPAMCCMVFVCMSFCSISLWVTINWIMILCNAVKDGDGNPLYREFK